MVTITRPKALVFDVNETLLDLSPVQQAFQQTFEKEYAFKHWFSLLLQYSLVDTLTDNYHNFKHIGEAVLPMTAAYFGKDLSEEEKQHLLSTVAGLSPHPDVEAGLRQLKEAGFRLVTLTNSPNETLTKQMERTGLNLFFEATWSVDDVQLYKPHPKSYQLALSRLQLAPQDTMMVAAHGWDIAGAAQAGMQTAFIARQGQALYPLAPAPTLIGDDLPSIARQLLAR